MGIKLTTEEFINRAKLVHGDKYDYSESVYVNARTNIKIKCKDHGEFQQKPYNHLGGNGCKWCAIHKKAKSQKPVRSQSNTAG